MFNSYNIHYFSQISEVSSIPVENVEFAKGKGTFPCDMSAYEIPTDLDWSKKTGLLDKRPIYILDDGAVVYFKLVFFSL